MLKITFDGDKVAVTIILTKEANDEALAFLQDPQAFFSLDGKNQRLVLNKDSISGIYGLTKDNSKAKPLNDTNLLNEIVNSTVNTMDVLVKHTLDDWDEEKKKIIPAQYSIESPCEYTYSDGKKYKTTIGRAVFNKVICEPLGLPFLNEPLTKGKQSKLLKDIDNMCLTSLSNDTENKEFFKTKYIPFLNRWEEFCFVMADLFSPSIDMNIYATSEEYDAFRDTLISENKEAIENGDIIVYDDVETKLINKLKETTKKEGVDTSIFDSGSKLSYNDDLRNGLVAVGPMPVGVGAGKFKISMSGLLYGTTKAERATYAQSNIVAGYFRAMGPATGGTIAKEILAATHNIKMGPKGSDCGRKVGQKYEVDDYYVEHLDMRYMIKEDGSLEKLTSESLKTKYFGKRITVRAVHFCGRKGEPCNICNGDKPYVVASTADTINIGAQKSRTGDEITQTSLSKFHESKTKFEYIDFNDYIVFPNANISEGMDPFEGMYTELNSFVYNIHEDLGDVSDQMDDVLDEVDRTLDDVLELTAEELIDNSVERELLGDMADTADLHRMITDLYSHIVPKALDVMTVVKKDEVIGEHATVYDLMKIFSRMHSLEATDFLGQVFLEDIKDSGYYLSKVSEEHDWYRLGLVVFKVDKTIIADTSVRTIGIFLTELSRIGEEYDFKVDVTGTDEAYFVSMEYSKFIQRHYIENWNEDNDELMHSEITESASDIATGRDEIVRMEKRLRAKTEVQINALINNAAIQKKKARENISSSMQDKASKLDAQMKVSKEEYRKHLQQLMADFEVNYDKANKFKLFKLKNKLNFIYSKKSVAIENAMNEAIRHIRKKNSEKIRTNAADLRAKYGM